MADGLITLTGGWQKIATAGQTVKVQCETGSVQLLPSVVMPTGTTGALGIGLSPPDVFSASLALDLYAIGLGTVFLISGLSSGGGGGGGGGAVTIADTADVAQGGVADAPTVGTISGKLAAIRNRLLGSSGMSPSGVTPATGSLSAVGATAPFAPSPGRIFNVTVYGTFVATVRLERSFDGTTWFPLTAAEAALCVYTAPASEQWEEDEAGVTYRLNCTAFTSGSINFRLSQ